MPRSFPHTESGAFERLAVILERAKSKARETGRAVLVSVAERCGAVDVVEALRQVSSSLATVDVVGASSDDCMYWGHAAGGFELAGFGAAAVFTSSGEDRFAQVDTAWSALLDEALIDDLSGGLAGVGPTLMGGFSFDPHRTRTARWHAFPEALLFLPHLQLAVVEGEGWLTTNAVVRPEGFSADGMADLMRLRRHVESVAGTRSVAPVRAKNEGALELADALPVSEWRAIVGEAVAQIRSGALEKVVLAREARAAVPRDLSIASVLSHLRSAHPDCYVFGFCRGDSAFVGASPERLVRLDGREVRASSLAGSIRRGASSREDAALGAQLMASGKDREEHEIVRRSLCASMATLCDDITADDEPSILSLPQVHHLHTRVRARLREDHSLLELVAKLHPTPAVGGAPRNAALAFIREHERLDRGWYAAPIGWLQGDRGEFAVALRSALITGDEASLFAGCGVVADSVPEQEYVESLLKLRPMELALKASLARQQQDLQIPALDTEGVA